MIDAMAGLRTILAAQEEHAAKLRDLQARGIITAPGLKLSMAQLVERAEADARATAALVASAEGRT